MKPPFKLSPAFKKTDPTRGLAAVTVRNDLRSFDVTIRGVDIGTLWNTHYHHTGSDRYGGEPRWKFTLTRGDNGANVTYKAENTDPEEMKKWLRGVIDKLWNSFPDDVKDAIIATAKKK